MHKWRSFCVSCLLCSARSPLAGLLSVAGYEEAREVGKSLSQKLTAWPYVAHFTVLCVAHGK